MECPKNYLRGLVIGKIIYHCNIGIVFYFFLWPVKYDVQELMYVWPKILVKTFFWDKLKERSTKQVLTLKKTFYKRNNKPEPNEKVMFLNFFL